MAAHYIPQPHIPSIAFILIPAMPAVPEGKVLVSGCNGYIAVWVVKLLLEDGFSVRGTVRRESVIPYLKEFFKSYGDKFEVVIVPDITKVRVRAAITCADDTNSYAAPQEGAFDEAVKGVDAIEHTASPFSLNADDPQEIIGPAVAGTVGMLDSAFRVANDTVRRIIVTSSCSSVLTVDPTNMKLNFFSERDWNEQSVREVEEKGRSADNIDKYHASKSLAERAAWKWAEEHRGVAKFDVVALNPPYVYGPVLHDVKSADALNTSMLDFYNTIVKQNKSPEYIATLR